MKRRHKINPAKFFWTLLLGFGSRGERQIAGMRRAYEASTGDTLVSSSFHDRFTPELTKFLKAILAYVSEKVTAPTEVLRGSLAWIKDLVVTDATVIRFHDALAKAFAACRTNHTKAAAKLHIVVSVLGAGPSRVKISDEPVDVDDPQPRDSSSARLERLDKGRCCVEVQHQGSCGDAAVAPAVLAVGRQQR